MIKAVKEKIRQRMISEHKSIFSREKLEEKELYAIIRHLLDEIIGQEKIILSDSEKKRVVNEIINEVIGLGPLEVLLKDQDITEIMINGYNNIYIEKNGKKTLTDLAFDSDQQLMHFIHKLMAYTRRHVDESYPYTDIQLPDGSRVNIIIPPLSLDGPCVTIRKFSKAINTLDDLIRLETLDKKVGDFLAACIKAKVNIIFSGATGVGKTTTLNVLSSFIDNDERIVTIEDTSELQLKQDHVVRLEARQANIEGKGEVSIRELFKNSLRMRPDRIIIGEIRSSEALDMLQGICSGHTGSLAIVHGNSPQDIIYRLETVILTSGLPVTLEFIHRQIQAALNLIVHQQQLSDGSRKITYVTQVNGIKDDVVVLEDIFRFVPDETIKGNLIKGRWVATGIIPVFYHLLKETDMDIPESIFKQD